MSGENVVPRVILGCQPFIGESYQGPERNRVYAERFRDFRNVADVLERAVVRYRVSALAAVPASVSSLAVSFMKAVKVVERRTSVFLSLTPCLSIPLRVKGKPVDDYRRWLTYYEHEKHTDQTGLLEKYLTDPILLTRPNWRENFMETVEHSSPYTSEELNTLTVDYGKIDVALESLKENRILFTEPGSETDFLAATGKVEELWRLIEYLRGRGFKKVFLGVHHAGTTIPILEESRLNFDGYVTPVNRLGAMMFPSREKALQSIKSTVKTVVAIKPMAGGRIPPREAFRYVFKESGVQSTMVGVASREELDIDMKAIEDTLH